MRRDLQPRSSEDTGGRERLERGAEGRGRGGVVYVIAPSAHRVSVCSGSVTNGGRGSWRSRAERGCEVRGEDKVNIPLRLDELVHSWQCKEKAK